MRTTTTMGRAWAILLAALLLLGSALEPALAREKIYFDIDEEPGGQTYGRWAAEWWQWALGVPGATNPLIDPTGASCGERQVDDVWFLAGTFLGAPAIRECTIPEGVSLFFPLINSAYFAFLNDPPETRTEEFVREIARCKYPVELFLEMDGEEVTEDKDLQKLFTGESGSQTPLFNLQLPPGNVFGVDETVVPELVLSPSAEEGYYIMLRPLEPGEHTIHFVATGCFDPEAVQDITYYLTVRGGESATAAPPESGSGSLALELPSRRGIRVPRDLSR